MRSGLGHKAGLRDTQTSFNIEVGYWVSVENPKQEGHKQCLEDVQAGPVNRDVSQAAGTGHLWSEQRGIWSLETKLRQRAQSRSYSIHLEHG